MVELPKQSEKEPSPEDIERAQKYAAGIKKIEEKAKRGEATEEDLKIVEELVRKIKAIFGSEEEEKLDPKVESYYSHWRTYKNGERICHYEGECDRWEPHPQGIVIRVGNKFLLNGTEVIYEGKIKLRNNKKRSKFNH